MSARFWEDSCKELRAQDHQPCVQLGDVLLLLGGRETAVPSQREVDLAHEASRTTDSRPVIWPFLTAIILGAIIVTVICCLRVSLSAGRSFFLFVSAHGPPITLASRCVATRSVAWHTPLPLLYARWSGATPAASPFLLNTRQARRFKAAPRREAVDRVAQEFADELAVLAGGQQRHYGGLERRSTVMGSMTRSYWGGRYGPRRRSAICQIRLEKSLWSGMGGSGHEDARSITPPHGCGKPELVGKMTVVALAPDSLLRIAEEWQLPDDIEIRPVAEPLARGAEPFLAADAPRTLRHVRETLSANAMQWLLRCAAYPSLHWELTRALAPPIVAAQMMEDALLELCSLPWFRGADIPERDRSVLARELSGLGQAEIDRQTSLPKARPTL